MKTLLVQKADLLSSRFRTRFHLLLLVPPLLPVDGPIRPDRVRAQYDPKEGGRFVGQRLDVFEQIDDAGSQCFIPLAGAAKMRATYEILVPEDRESAQELVLPNHGRLRWHHNQSGFVLAFRNLPRDLESFGDLDSLTVPGNGRVIAVLWFVGCVICALVRLLVVFAVFGRIRGLAYMVSLLD